MKGIKTGEDKKITMLVSISLQRNPEEILEAGDLTSSHLRENAGKIRGKNPFLHKMLFMEPHVPH